MKFFVPMTLDVQNLSQLGQEQLPEFQRWKLLYYVHVLIYLPAIHKGYRSESGYVNLQSTLLKTVLGDHYITYKRFLIRHGVIEHNPSYSTGHFSKSFRLTPDFLTVPFDRIEVSKKDLPKGVSSEVGLDVEDKRRLGSYLHITRQYDRLQFDYEGARKYEAEISFRLLSHPGLIDERYSHARLSEIRINNLLLRDGEFRMKVDSTSQRFHSVLTRLKKEFRHFLRLRGSHLVGLDLKSSQPYISQLLLDPSFWSTASERRSSRTVGSHPKAQLTLSDIKGRIDRELTGVMRKIEDSSPMFRHRIEKAQNQCVVVYRKLLNGGDIYCHFQGLISAAIGNDCNMKRLYEARTFPLERNEMKSLVLMAMYGPARTTNPSAKLVHSIFKKHFPKVYSVFRSIKNVSPKDYRVFSLLLQAIESEVMLNRVAKKIISRSTQIPFFTIHDSILTIPKYASIVKEVMESEFEIAIGVPPTVKIEDYSLEALKSKPVPSVQPDEY